MAAQQLVTQKNIQYKTGGKMIVYLQANFDFMSKKGKVLVAMSGGIDSTVVALMLNDEGYDVVGITMKTWDYAASGGSKKETGCCNVDSFNDARMAAVQHGFPHYILDIREEFCDFVIDNFVDEYIAGRTPNPETTGGYDRACAENAQRIAGTHRHGVAPAHGN
jgi:predicted subunit of tRNA(5-methylaminomethyl-2-thiouridylate) methyltransferase